MVAADLNGKAVLVTGGSSGIGLAAVELFARDADRRWPWTAGASSPRASWTRDSAPARRASSASRPA